MRQLIGLVIAGCVLQATGAPGQAPSDETTVTANDILADALSSAWTKAKKPISEDF